jgi:predicted nucleic acid-binding protein
LDAAGRRRQRGDFRADRRLDNQRILVTLEPELLTPAFVRKEISNYEDLIVEKSGMSHERVSQFVDLLFQYIETVPADDIYPQIERAEQAIGDIDPDDVLYLACALTVDAGIWSDDDDFREQGLVPVYSTADVIDAFETV